LRHSTPNERQGTARPPGSGTAFIGRDTEKEFLLGRFKQAQAGRPSIVLVSGEAGIGKTRLIREIAPELHADALVAVGHCQEDLDLPYFPFVEVVRSCLDQCAEATGSLSDEEERLLLEFSGRKRPESPPGGAPARPGPEKGILTLAISRFLLAAANVRPLVLLIEDLHWMDRPSMAIFAHLAFALSDEASRGSAPLMIVATYRPHEPPPHVASAVARLKREVVSSAIDLVGLTEGEVREAVRRMVGPRPSQELVISMMTATQGNPLFLREAIAQLLENDSLEEKSGYLVSRLPASQLRLPAVLRDAISERLGTLEPEARDVLLTAACLGDPFVPEELLACRPDEEVVLASLDDGVQRRFLFNEGAAIRFAHPLFRSLLYEEASVPSRQRVHHQIAQALERLYSDDPDPHVMRIANHLVAAGSLAPHEKVVEYTREAGERATQVFAWGEAAGFFSVAADRASESASFSPHDVAELQYHAGLAHFRDMDPAPVLDRLGRAIEGFGTVGDSHGVLRAEVLKARTHMTIGDLPVGILMDVEPLRTAIDAIEDDEIGLTGEGLWQLSQCYWHAQRLDEATDMAESALRAGREVRDERLCAEALTTRGLIHFSSIELEAAADDLAESAKIALSLGDPWLATYPLPRLCPALISLGRLDEAWTAVDEACRVTAEVHDWAEYSFALAYKVAKAYLLGDLESVERLSAEGLAAARRSGYVWGPAVFLPTLACARMARGLSDDAADALTLLVEPGAITEEPDPQFLTLALAFRILVSAATGERDTVAQLMSVVRAQLQGQLRHDIHALSAYCAVAEACSLHGDADLLKALAEPLQFARDRGAVICSSGGFLLPRVLGLIRAGLGDFRGAEAHFQEALEISERWELRPNIALTSLNYAEMLADHGKSNDRERAATLILRSAEISEELGMDFFVQRARSVGASLAAAVPSSSTRPTKVYPDGLTGRELEVLRLIAEARTNQQIADELVLSVKTVHRHVSNIFVKAEVTNRAGATAYAFERGLMAE